jgi:alanyl-tRNA synthetase
MGDGPCGPCTEIFYDFGGNENLSQTKELYQKLSIADLESKRFLEVGNIVFSEYYHQGEEYLPLQQKCVDFGGGLERIGMVLQGKKNAFETDL